MAGQENTHRSRIRYYTGHSVRATEIRGWRIHLIICTLHHLTELSAVMRCNRSPSTRRKHCDYRVKALPLHCNRNAFTIWPQSAVDGLCLFYSHIIHSSSSCGRNSNNSCCTCVERSLSLYHPFLSAFIMAPPLF